MLSLRELIFSTAKTLPEVGALEETLKWGQPSYLTSETGTGSMIRIDARRVIPGTYAMYFHCQTTLVDSFRAIYGSIFRYEGNRALIFSASVSLPQQPVRACITAALTYHHARKTTRVAMGHFIK